MSAAAYLRVGGFAPLPTGEDRDLAARLFAAATGSPVPTSMPCTLRPACADGLPAAWRISSPPCIPHRIAPIPFVTAVLNHWAR
ncbi:hypothetical protein ACFYW8_43570 [Streptomyces sp. NPDC002742]|uniref:hypothetical protein n=1 Tax=Streptomyces sp. NPDC002742 TaxID=3364663 RepID=UPI0036CCBF0A